MAATRYARIYHTSTQGINIQFLSAAARTAFSEKFNAFHASHEHDGKVPRIENVNRSKIGTWETIHKVETVTIDGYSWSEIRHYHEQDMVGIHTRYEMPTCCIPPIIEIDNEFVDSVTLTRHELSAIFGDMPDEDYQSLLESVKAEGFIDNVIRLVGNQVLDGWHRYRAATELNIIRKLRFTQWKADEGKPHAFVIARNIERRHLSASLRAQIVISVNERFEKGNVKAQRDDSGTPNGEPKTREELAREAHVGIRTIDRAVQVEKAGASELVISGEKSASEVLKEREASKVLKEKKKILKDMWDIRKRITEFFLDEGDTPLNTGTTLVKLEKGFAKATEYLREPFERVIPRFNATSYMIYEERALESGISVEDLWSEHKAMRTYEGDLRLYKREDWSPSTNWILPMLKVKDDEPQATPEPAPEPTPEPEETLSDDGEVATSGNRNTETGEASASPSSVEVETEDEANDASVGGEVEQSRTDVSSDVMVLPYAEPRPVSDVKIAPPTDEKPFPTPKKWARLVVNTDTLRILLKTYPLIDDTNFHDGLLDELQDAFVQILKKRGYIKEDDDE